MTRQHHNPLSVGQCATLACLLEVCAPKPGNVHRSADFEDVTLTDFMASAVAIAPAMQSAAGMPVGQTVLAAVKATRSMTRTNTNLGTVLLLAPLASVPIDVTLAQGVADVLAGLSPEDSRSVYEAIRLAQPGGLGRVGEADVSQVAPDCLLRAMRIAAERDTIARQYAHNFSDILTLVVPWLAEGQRRAWTLTDGIIQTHVRLMSQYPDSLIARKCGEQVARESADRAAEVLAAGQPGDEGYHRALADLDFWLRSDGHRRNPGTTADLIAAGLFAGLRDGIIQAPYR